MTRGMTTICSVIVTALLCGCKQNADSASGESPTDVIVGPVVVSPADDLQSALDRAATAKEDRRLVLQPGTYRTVGPAFCLLAITAKHDGVVIEGTEGATLSARSATDPQSPAVGHIIYCGDGLSAATVVRGLTLTGAKGLATNTGVPSETYGPRTSSLTKGLFYFMDGGAVKIYGSSSPVFDHVEFVDNETNLCGGAVSVEQQGFREHPATFRNCRFLNNRCPGTGSAVDVLEGSSARIENCLFAKNIANYGMDEIASKYGLTYNQEHGTGALTVFPKSHVSVHQCTFVNNWNGADDRGTESVFEDSIFASNNASDGSRPGHPYELDILHARHVRNCLFFSDHADLRGTIPSGVNTLDAPDPEFDENYIPQNKLYQKTGYRP